ncbi:non-specific lipid-transfer protein 2P [Brachypodium distachyon]|uniref:Bifunctional inhibitor/plant lipid transfer protein/seed storage helical domain-containing protein n=1 Tax=Brachypodium distachyon TaxID=15368 RepID=I1I581_BRADI|nr:non-specific lipid-transfer protein 2P [Brachypodium distachyon]KQJ97367.1 hypothetical protein BRADI_3g30310v3 [Brachypodium distachyon]|eukprot:XP_014756231.1 non-specific lipid-transfer protein 2P [Brachypodium distachyon]
MAKAAAMSVVVTAALVIVLVATATAMMVAAQCDAGQLVVCAPAILGGAMPTASCCSKLREQEQQGCFCEYLRNPAYAGYINSQTARGAIAACNVTLPQCS